MKLTELNPKWVGVGWGLQTKIGIRFDCPHCKEMRLVVLFKPFIEVSNETQMAAWAFPSEAEGTFWRREGESLESITLTPSIDSSFSGHWHGYVVKGEIK